MFGIPLFPERASTIAGEVDALYFFLVGLSVVMSAAHRGTGRRLRHQIPPPARQTKSARRCTAVCCSSLRWTFVPFLITMVIFFWGAKVYFVMASPPPKR